MNLLTRCTLARKIQITNMTGWYYNLAALESDYRNLERLGYKPNLSFSQVQLILKTHNSKLTDYLLVIHKDRPASIDLGDGYWGAYEYTYTFTAYKDINTEFVVRFKYYGKTKAS